MKVESFKQVLLRKSLSDDLRSFISSADEDTISNFVLETLEKSKHLNTNEMVKHFGSDLATSKKLRDMMYDHISHHATRYNSALKAGNRELAGKHASRVMLSLFLMEKLTKDIQGDHTGGTMRASFVDPKAWERNLYTEPKAADDESKGSDIYNPISYFKTHVQGVGRFFSDPKKWSFLQQSPHFSHAKSLDDEHVGGWPIEKIKINDRHVHIDDDHFSSGEYELHPLDEHPIMSHSVIDKPNKKLTPQDVEKYIGDSINFGDTYISSKSEKRYKPLGQELGQNPASIKTGSVHHETTPLDLNLHREISKAGSMTADQSMNALKQTMADAANKAKSDQNKKTAWEAERTRRQSNPPVTESSDDMAARLAALVSGKK